VSRKRKPLSHFKARTCRLYWHICAVCCKRIEPGERYYDGGYGRRAHIDCGNAAEFKPELEKTPAEQDAASGLLGPGGQDEPYSGQGGVGYPRT
jgi:hypothetical protein